MIGNHVNPTIKDNGERSKVSLYFFGDIETAGTGKSSIIKTHICERYFDTVPDLMNPTTEILDGTETLIIDTNASFIDETQNMLRDIDPNEAVAICIVLSYDRPFKSASKWLALVNQYQPTIPILIVINKVDLIDEDNVYVHNSYNGSMLNSYCTRKDEEELIDSIIENKQVERVVKCSAQYERGLKELFGYAQAYAMFPGSKLYDLYSKEETLDVRVKQAFSYIFKILDTNKDGLIEEDQLIKFKDTYIRDLLSTETFDELKREAENLTEAGYQGDVNFKGFLSMWEQLLKKCRFDVIWVVLRRFGFDDSLGNKSLDIKMEARRRNVKLNIKIPWFYYPGLKKNIVLKCADIL